ncbi:outer membrane autotransporter barrel domain-containing protein [Pseudomonas sp. NFACC02]|uniref:autotransporter outer membrane beta-barrel domain-containing protein n=1 Tax=Pseudomonas TaxID=286 RepID=UPI0008C43EFB|nr:MULTISPECIES: autotransporter outer membrane beta-barrel domain-containing protein [Pseudomonas]SER48939.1 outer membrane autotransporter barrel domain-containing protein [Pseudomonas sp. NFACC02]
MSGSLVCVSRIFKPSRFLSLTMCVSAANAAVVNPGDSAVVNPGDAVDSWSLLAGSTLTVNGAQTLSIRASAAAATVTLNPGSTTQAISLGEGSVVTISDSNVVAAPGQTFGLAMTGSSVAISNSNVSNANGVGISGSQNATTSIGSRFSILGGTVSGSLGGITLSEQSSLDMDGTQVTGTGATSYGVLAFGSDMTLRNSIIAGGRNGIVFRGTGTTTRVGTTNLDGTHVEGQSGAAILLDGRGEPVEVNLNLLNGTTLTGSNGNVLEVIDSGTANVRVQNSAIVGDVQVTENSTVNLAVDQGSLTGDIVVDGTSQGALSLQNQATFTGNLINVENVAIGDQSTWNMVASNTVGALAMSGGAVKFGGADQFYQLNVANLSGNGTFIMDVDFATNQHDTLNVTGTATGSHTLLIAGSGVDPVSPQQLTVVQTAAGDATFALAGGRAVDVGTFSYDLASVANGSGGTDWFLDPTTKTISPGTASALALFNTAPTVWYGELTSLRSRMGELRLNKGDTGVWMRTYGNKYDVSQSSGLGYKQTQYGFSLGADAPLPVGDGQWLVGVLAGQSNSSLDLNRGTSGSVKSYYAGVYTTWLDQDSGYYFDGVLKFNRFRNDAKVSMSDGTRAKGNYDNSGAGASLEFGRHIKLEDGYFVEPFTQLSAVVIQGKSFTLDNDMQADGDRSRSLLGKAGVTAGRNFTLDNGSVVQPYVKVAAAHEFAKNNRVAVNDNTFNNDLSGSRAELGAGVAVAFSENLQVHADFDYANGENIEQPLGANLGVRYSW